MRRRICSFGRGILSVSIIAGLLLGMLAEAKAAPYFQGKVITLVVPTAAGGASDLWARILSGHFTKYVPGKPSIVIRNIPGGAESIGGNFVWKAKPNGLTCLAFSGGNVMNNVLRPEGVAFRLEEMPPIYASAGGMLFYCRSHLIKEPKDIMTAKGLIFGQQDPTSSIGAGFVWAKELLGFTTEKLIWGYGGSAQTRLAFLTNEINFSGESVLGYNSALKSYADKGELIPVFQSGLLNANGDVIRDPAASDTPTVLELYQQIYRKTPSGPVCEVNKLIAGTRTYGKGLAFPKGTPAPILDILRKAVAEMVKDPKFLSDSDKMSPKAPHIFGEQLIRAYPKGVSAPPEIPDFMKKVLTEKYGSVWK